MNDVVDIEGAREHRHQYRQALHHVARELRMLEEQVYELTVKLALAGPLRAWDEQMPVGAIARIDEKFLADTGDERILTLLSLKEQVYDAVARLYELSPK